MIEDTKDTKDTLDNFTQIYTMMTKLIGSGQAEPMSPNRLAEAVSEAIGIYPVPNLAVDRCTKMFTQAAEEAPPQIPPTRKPSRERNRMEDILFEKTEDRPFRPAQRQKRRIAHQKRAVHASWRECKPISINSLQSIVYVNRPPTPPFAVPQPPRTRLPLSVPTSTEPL
jgi:hypothetical protein